MIINEILSKSSGQIKVSNKEITDDQPVNTHSIEGMGAQAIAYVHKKFPNKTIKFVQCVGVEDPVYQFLRLCINHQDNPFFPKIYHVKRYNTKEQTRGERLTKFIPHNKTDSLPYPQSFTLIVVMEKLQRLRMSDVSMEKMKMMGADTLPNILLPTSTLKASEEYKTYVKFQAACEEPKYRKMMYDHITDPHLKQAVKLLEPLFNHYTPDMHMGNIMVRPNGQWVILDPITYGIE